MLASLSAIKVEIIEAKGSTPRGVGAVLYVSKTEQSGTIGGGALEWEAIAHARKLLDEAERDMQQTIALGPQINQCCGGQVTLSFTPSGGHFAPVLRPEIMHDIYIFGAGHTGTAIAQQLLLLDMKVHIIDERHEWLERLTEHQHLTRHQEALPETLIASAPAQSAFIVTTHSHDLDFAITSAALTRKDVAYVGMIGSKTKRERFRRWAQENELRFSEEQLHCPMGIKFEGRKEPEIIALSVAYQIMGILSQRSH